VRRRQTGAHKPTKTKELRERSTETKADAKGTRNWHETTKLCEWNWFWLVCEVSAGDGSAEKQWPLQLLFFFFDSEVVARG